MDGAGLIVRAGMPAAQTPIVELRDVDVRFYRRRGLLGRSEVRAVTGVSLTVPRGRTLALVGESGSGKTTVGRATLLLVPPSGGAVLFDGRDVTYFGEGDLRGFRRRAQAVFQDPYSSLNPYMTALQTVEEPLRIHGVAGAAERRDRALQVLEDVQLRPAEVFAPAYPHTLSGGQRQRLGVARALVLQPDYIVADEPVSMIDASSRAEILYLLRDLQSQYGVGFLYITHDIASARHFADRIAVMYLGSIVEEGPPEVVVERPLHPYTQALIAAVPEPDPANRSRYRPVVAGEPPDPGHVPQGCPFHPRCPEVIAGTCTGERPVLRTVEQGRSVACYLYDRRTGVAPDG